MAREAEQAFTNVYPSLSLEQENKWLEGSILLNISELTKKISLEYIFNIKNKKYSLSKYLTLFESTSLFDIAMALLYLKTDNRYLFQVLNQAPFKLKPRYLKAIKDRLVRQNISGDIQRSFAEKKEIPFLWHIPYPISALSFLKVYYKDNLDQLTKFDNQLIEVTEKMTCDDFLSMQIEHYPTLIEKKGSVDVFNIFFSLLTSWRLNGTLPEYSIPFLERENILTEIISIDYPTNIYCLNTLISLIIEIIQWEKPHWIDHMSEKFERVDFAHLSIEQEELLI